MVTVEEILSSQRAEGPAAVLVIGTATPPNCIDQSTYPDYYFRVTDAEYMTDLKSKFKRVKSHVKREVQPLTSTSVEMFDGEGEGGDESLA